MDAPLTSCLFPEPWWLDAVAPGQWQAGEVCRGGRVEARLPYRQWRRMGLACVGMPKLTQTLGPCFRSGEGKQVQRLKRQRDLLNELLDQLPPFDWYSQAWHYSPDNWLPLYWRGFQCTTRYTYVFHDLANIDAVVSRYSSHTRRQIKKAARELAIRTDLPFDDFWRLNEKTFIRQGRRPPYSRTQGERIDAACAARNARRIFFAEDGSGAIHAALYLIWDARSAYYLMGGSDPELRQSGALSFLMDAAIRFSATVSERFDFEGSMIPSIERFVHNFGATPQPFLQITGQSRKMNVIQAVRSAFRRRAA